MAAETPAAKAFAEEYAEKIFYFCLKKTGDSREAEDLASDIVLSVVHALTHGPAPRQLSAYVWAVARNRYAAWARQKRLQRERTTPAPLDVLALPDENADSEARLLRAEETRLLRRELALISADYRQILAAYYFDRKRVSEIAKTLGCPQGTVLSKLHRARNILKEGMQMAREFGKRSYQPEEVSFISSGSQSCGLPWTAIGRKIPDNILCAAHNNPSTAQELALELGVALPYMEEEIRLLQDAELLLETEGGRYLTNFMILSRETQTAVNEICCAYTKAHAADLWTVAKAALKKAGELGVTWGDYSENDGEMYFALCLEQQIEWAFQPKGLYTATFRRANGDTWGLVGFEQGGECPLPQDFFNNNCCCTGGLEWNGFQAHSWNREFPVRRYAGDCPDAGLLPAMKRVAEGAADDSPAGRENLNRLTQGGFCGRRPDGSAYVNAFVFLPGVLPKILDFCDTLPLFAALKSDMAENVRQVRKTVAAAAHKRLREHVDYYAGMAATARRATMARAWKDQGLYTGDQGQFCAFFLGK